MLNSFSTLNPLLAAGVAALFSSRASEVRLRCRRRSIVRRMLSWQGPCSELAEARFGGRRITLDREEALNDPLRAHHAPVRYNALVAGSALNLSSPDFAAGATLDCGGWQCLRCGADSGELQQGTPKGNAARRLPHNASRERRRPVRQQL